MADNDSHQPADDGPPSSNDHNGNSGDNGGGADHHNGGDQNGDAGGGEQVKLYVGNLDYCEFAWKTSTQCDSTVQSAHPSKKYLVSDIVLTLSSSVFTYPAISPPF
jgi:hypothetical protein